MLAIILKDLRLFTNTRKYRLIHYIVLVILVILLFSSTVEFYAQGIKNRTEGNHIDVGKRSYSLLIIGFFILHFIVLNLGVEAACLEEGTQYFKDKIWKYGKNRAHLALTPIQNWKILSGKLTAIIIWTLWGVWFTIPIFVLASYIGGLAMLQLVKCGTVIFINCMFFGMISFGIAQWNTPSSAKGISYGIVFAISFLPLTPIPPFSYVPMFNLLSPICSLISIISLHQSHLWGWHVCTLIILCLLTFPVLVRRMR